MPAILNLAPLNTPPLVQRAALIGDGVEFTWDPAWVKYFALLNAFFNGGGGSGGTGGGFMSGQDVTAPGQVITLPFPTPAVGARGMLILTQDAGGGNTISWDPAKFGAGESTDINLNPLGETRYDLFTQDRGTGALWYLANQPYLVFL